MAWNGLWEVHTGAGIGAEKHFMSKSSINNFVNHSVFNKNILKARKFRRLEDKRKEKFKNAISFTGNIRESNTKAGGAFALQILT